VPEVVRLIDPHRLKRNPENPRLIFRKDELDALQDSIAKLGILVPLTVYEDNERLFLLDGERRWRCALKLGLPKVPVILQPKPDRMANIMLMFAIHNSRKDWDPLPTARKLRELEDEFKKRNGRRPTEVELAGVASISRGEVRRLKKLLTLPQEYQVELLRELEKPRSEQEITVDHVLETTKGVEALRKRGIIDEHEENSLRRVILQKFRSKVITNTVSPRKLARIARAVQREEVPHAAARRVITRLLEDARFSIDNAFTQSVEKVDFEHAVEQLAERLIVRLEEHQRRDYQLSDSLISTLRKLAACIDAIFRR